MMHDLREGGGWKCAGNDFDKKVRCGNDDVNTCKTVDGVCPGISL